MAFDQELAGRVRAVLAAAGQAPAEKKMFGGLSFLIAGNMWPRHHAGNPGRWRAVTR